MSRTALCLLAVVVLCGAMAPWLLSSAAPKENPVKKNDDAASEKERTSESRKDKSEHGRLNRGVISNLLPVGATRNGNDPPLDLRKHLQRSGTTPHRLQRRLEPLSSDFEQRPQPVFSRYARGMVGQDGMLRGSRTQRIMDIFRYAVGH